MMSIGSSAEAAIPTRGEPFRCRFDCRSDLAGCRRRHCPGRSVMAAHLPLGLVRRESAGRPQIANVAQRLSSVKPQVIPVGAGPCQPVCGRGLVVRRRLGGHDGIGSGVKGSSGARPRKRLDLEARPHPVDDIRPLPAFSSAEVVFSLTCWWGYVSSGLDAWCLAGVGR